MPTATLHCETAPKLNFACHQSAFPYLRELRIQNDSSSEALADVVVTLSSNPAFLESKSWRIERIAPGGVQSITDREIELDGQFLLDLADSVQGTTQITVEHQGSVVGEETKPVELLAYNEWGGAGYMPELLAAFSRPNDPAVDRILHDASGALRRAGKPDGIDGYRSGSRQRVWEIASAIYTAICNLGIRYSLPPASFERDGQKVRLPSQILDGRIATCLDLSLLFASAMEQAGLNPVVALPKEHAVAGVWLQPEDLSSIVVDEAEVLRKRAELNELILVETTLVTNHPSPPFSRAVKAALDPLSLEHDETFSAAIDIRRARAHRITPLGLTSSDTGRVAPSSDDTQVEVALEEAPALPAFDSPLVEDSAPETPEGRLERWQRKLLDLSARNPLLNHRATRTSLNLICAEPGRLEDKLAEGARIRIQSVPEPTGQAQDEELHRRRTGETITEEYARDALEKNQILVDLDRDELSRRAVSIYRRTQTALQEGGANILYVALGFLSWKRDQRDQRAFRAPLILLPVTLTRESVRSGVRMLAHDDEPRFNTTLLEMLRKDFEIHIAGLDGTLPADDSGVDVDGIWDRVRKAVRDAPGFEVVTDVVLGHFSFAKYLMWKDLVDRIDALRASPIVSHLIDTPRDPYTSDIEFVHPDDIDRRFSPSDLLAPLPADASQMAAIATADRGKDFVVIGPPGTGKSQTIANLIAHLLGKSKSILFVSEKTAALEVVYRRLKDVGLGEFALELHSNKARKLDVLNQLRDAWEYGQDAVGDRWKAEAERLKRLRDQLNLVVDRLHLRRRNGMTVFEAMGVRIRDETLVRGVALSWPSADHHDEARLNAMREAAETLEVQARATDDIRDSPFRLIATGDWSPSWETKLVHSAGDLSGAATTVERECDAMLEAIGAHVPARSMERLDSLVELAESLRASWRKQTAFALEPDGPEHIEALNDASMHLHAYATAQTQLSCGYDPMAWRVLDGDDIERRWRATSDSWWLKRILERRRITREMKDGGAQGIPNPERDSPALKTLRDHGQAIDKLAKPLASFKEWSDHSSDPNALLVLRDVGQQVRNAVGGLVDDTTALLDTRGALKKLVADGNDLLAPDAAVGRRIHAFLEAMDRFRESCVAFGDLAGQPTRDYFTQVDDALDVVRETTTVIAERRHELSAWCAWRRRRNEALDLDLAPLIDAIEAGDVPVDEIATTFHAAYCSWWSGAVIDEDHVLRRFSTPEHVATIHNFRELDDRYQQLTAAYVGALLAGRLPYADSVTKKSSWGVLRRELQKQRRHKPVRQLMAEIPDVVTTLAPCLMMSPLSVAQYLSVKQDLFDVVIFDEASQITVWDAVGCLARARQAIVVGDPKQMPPTNFFARADDDPDGDIDVEGDLESILDELIGARIPERTLNLHYRSRKESLIAFSNSRYYENRLITFPAPAFPDNAVQLIRPEGFYARGKARHNEGEARAIVAEVVRRLTDDDADVRRQTIGVVTFNSEQQTLIEDLLDKERSANPGIEWAFAQEGRTEPVFVKNLETVQGDERDVIMFSITYAPDQADHMTMNFGPLNRDGGERRLNVAITRARSEMLVFSTLSPDRIELSRTQARAVADLKHFLEYAERGPTALGAAVHGPLGDFDSPFEAAVARALRQRGWVVHPQVGVSAYRIDLGVVHPDVPGRYLAGVECDGAMYHSSAFARERDKIRQQVLEGLGWVLYRIWSTDWWTNQTKALYTLHEALVALLVADQAKRSAHGADSPLGEDDNPEASEDVEQTGADEPLSRQDRPGTQVKDATKQQVDGSARREDELDATTEPDTHYSPSRWDPARHRPAPELFHADEYSSRLTEMIDHVIDSEGPIHEDVLVHRVARHHGFGRAGNQIRRRVIGIAKRRRGKSKEDVGLFFWRKGTIKERQAPVRYSGRDAQMRKVGYICADELRAISRILNTTDPITLARSLGVERLRQHGRERLQQVLGVACHSPVGDPGDEGPAE
ncbi:MAG: DUF3320 domain-containing protein [Gammaproteobacteria bacterium]|nr:DUF3320 domain-containing protein [Gammaproteobacteria bacterium]MYK48342.1 DUF3320 domain-containing protein [Gammaproteobacteria bacterium]